MHEAVILFGLIELPLFELQKFLLFIRNCFYKSLIIGRGMCFISILLQNC